MTISADFLDFAVFLIGLGVFIFALAFIPALLQLKRTLKAAEELTQETRKTVEVVNFIATKAQNQVDDIDEIVKGVKELGRKVTGLGDLIVENVKTPIIGFLSFLLGAEEGFKRFFRKDKEKTGGGRDE